MPAPIIRNYLLRDTVDSTAEAIYLLNASGWASPADVPVYLYTSLCTLWTGASSGSSRIANYTKALVAQSGEGKKPPNNCITISPLICESTIAGASEGGDMIMDDAIGGEDAQVAIIFQVSQAPPTAIQDRAQNAELRTRLLLDCNLRPLSGGSISIPIDNTDELSIDASAELFLLSWQGYGTDPSAQAIISTYSCSYVRDFGRAIIPL